MSKLFLVFICLHMMANLVVSDVVDENGCVTGAEKNAISGKCVCKKGYTGQGDICCVLDPAISGEKETCFVSGDPFIHGIQGKIMSLNFPCSHQLAHINIEEGNACVLEIMGSSSTQEEGKIFYTQLQIGVFNDEMFHFISLSADKVSILTHDLDDNINTKTVTLDKNGTADMTVAGKPVKIREYDTGLKTVLVCGVEFAFRPRVKNEEIKASPGICITAPKQSFSMDAGACALSGLSGGYSMKSLMAEIIFSNEHLYQVQKFSEPKFKEVCDKINDDFANNCMDVSDEAIEKCGPILNHSGIRLCLDKEGEGEAKMAKLFKDCIKAFCPGNNEQDCLNLQASTALKKCIPTRYNCTEWPYFKKE